MCQGRWFRALFCHSATNITAHNKNHRETSRGPKISRAIGPDGLHGAGLRHVALRRVASVLIVAARRREILGGEDDDAVLFVASRRAATYANSIVLDVQPRPRVNREGA